MAVARDIGELMEVPEHERLDYDDYLPEEDNVDQFASLNDVPVGEYIELSTASDDEPIGDNEEDH